MCQPAGSVSPKWEWVIPGGSFSKNSRKVGLGNEVVAISLELSAFAAANCRKVVFLFSMVRNSVASVEMDSQRKMSEVSIFAMRRFSIFCAHPSGKFS